MIRNIFKRPHVYWLIGIFFVYLALTIYLSEFYITIKYIPSYLDTIQWSELIISGFFTLTIAALVSVNSVYGFMKYKQRRSIKKTGALTCAATVGGFATGVCPACVTGAFPLVLGFFGVSFTWGALPFQGLEIQAALILLLALGLYFLKKK